MGQPQFTRTAVAYPLLFDVFNAGSDGRVIGRDADPA
jgi:hypothetical protein